ncbi:MAG TPA: hypothetical protein PLG15_03965 [Candidatus Gastranaerophilaceae bacterium]|nr:hypothetical protein [Candidatus Gastranaerophilaceae bacterium]HPT41521.1 hypothetical protein [Candidatus Gastranaerophilaceae bacterium]
MKKMLVSLFAIVALAIGSQTTFAACPCSNPCPACPVIAPCCSTAMPCPACPVLDPCSCGHQSCCNSCCDSCNSCCDNCCKKKCRWWKFWENKNCCYKCNSCCDCCD